MKKKMAVVFSVLSWVLVGFIAFVAMFLIGARLIGFQPFAIESGSMTPAYPVGCLVYAKSAEFEDINVGDVIAFRTKDDVVVTHRVVEVDEEKGTFRTKGDANKGADGDPIPYENVIGLIRFSIPYVGHLTLYARTTSGKFALAAVFIFLILILVLSALLDTYKKEAKKQK